MQNAGMLGQTTAGMAGGDPQNNPGGSTPFVQQSSGALGGGAFGG